MDAQHGQIVKLRLILRKGAHVRADCLQQHFGACVAVFVEYVEKALIAVLLLLLILRLGDAVGVDKQLRAGRKVQLGLLVFHARHAADNKAVLGFQQLKIAVGRFQYRVFVPRVGGDERAVSEVEDTQPDRHEPLGCSRRSGG